ncbi:phosphate ABC transporter permease PstA [soil metagenome]
MTLLENRPDATPDEGGASLGADRPDGAQPLDPKGEQSRFRPRQLGSRDRTEMLLALAAGLTGSATLCLVFDWSHPLTFTIWALIIFLTATYLMARDSQSPIVAADRLVTTLVWTSGGIAVAVLAWMIVFVVVKGLPGLNLEFITTDMSKVGPLDDGGGALHAIVGTLEQMLIASALSIPIAILTAVYLHEIKGRLAGLVRFVIDAMSGLPSIVAGLFIYTIWVLRGHGPSGLAAGLALAILMIPTVTRTAEEMLKTIDDGLRESALALGAPQWRSVMQVVLPTARSGLITASILGVARAVGETAPVLLTAFGSSSTNWSPVNGPQSDLPLFVYQLLRQSNETQIARAWTGALVLVILVLILFVLVRFIGERGTRVRGGSR